MCTIELTSEFTTCYNREIEATKRSRKPSLVDFQSLPDRYKERANIGLKRIREEDSLLPRGTIVDNREKLQDFELVITCNYTEGASGPRVELRPSFWNET